MAQELKIQYKSTKELIPYVNNSRTHSDEQVTQIAASIREWGFTNPLLIDEQSGIIAGHGRLMAANKLGLEQVPTITLVGLTEAQRKAYVIADNKLALNAGWDDEILRIELNVLDELGFDLELTGFSLDELAALEDADLDDMPGDGAGDAPAGNLSERFLIPPFTVMNAREGWWQDRKRWWFGLGIKSELGRGNDASPGGSPRPAADYGQTKARGAGDGKAQLGGLLMQSWTSHPTFYPQKAAKEKELGRELTTAEFQEHHFVPPTDDAYSSGTSIFDPVLCEIAYRWFSPVGGLVLDPFAGGSVRGIVAAKLGREYIGHELRAEQVEANRKQGTDICGGDDIQPQWIIGDSRLIDKTCEGVQADFVFSCPPYADLEVYSDDPKDLSTLGYAEFKDAYFEIIKKACDKLKDNSFACFVVGEVRDKKGNYYDFVGDTVQAFRSAGLEYYNEAILVTAVGSLPIRAGKQFAASRKLGKTHQNILVFVKGDGKKAAARCGYVEISDDCFGEAVDENEPASKYGEVL